MRSRPATRPSQIDLLDLGHALGDQQSHIGAAGNERGIGVLCIERRERGFARRSGEEAGLVADEDILSVGKGHEALRGLRAVCGKRVVRRLSTGLQRGIDDGPITGAAAEIAGERVVRRAAAQGPLAFVVESEQAHHDAGRAEAALRTVSVHHGGLNRVQFPVRREILDRDELGSVDLAEQQDAGIDGLVMHPAAAHPAQSHGAGAAIALGATFLGADATLLKP